MKGILNKISWHYLLYDKERRTRRRYRMTIEEAYYHVNFGYDVMCDTQQDALSVASKFSCYYLNITHIIIHRMGKSSTYLVLF